MKMLKKSISILLIMAMLISQNGLALAQTISPILESQKEMGLEAPESGQGTTEEKTEIPTWGGGD